MRSVAVSCQAASLCVSGIYNYTTLVLLVLVLFVLVLVRAHVHVLVRHSYLKHPRFVCLFFLPHEALCALSGAATVSRPSVCLSVCLSISNADVPWSYNVDYFENNQKYAAEPNVRPPGVCASKPWSISSACKNLRGQHPLRAEIQSVEKLNLSRSTCRSITFLFVDQSSQSFLTQRGRGCIQLIKFVSDFRYVDLFRRYSRSNSKVVRNRAEFQTFFALPNFRGRAFPKNSAHLNTPASQYVTWKSFVTLLPLAAKLLGLHTLNFKPNFTCSPLNFWGGPPSPLGVCATKPWSICSTCKNLRGQHPVRAEIQSVEKFNLGGSKGRRKKHQQQNIRPPGTNVRAA